METTVGTQSSCLDLLELTGEEFNFYQAVRMLEDLTQADKRIAKLHFRVNNTQAFHPNFINHINHADGVCEVDVNGFGITGSQGPLPQVYADMFYRQQSQGQFGAHDFINIFNNRLLHLLFQIKKDFNPMLFNSQEGNYQLSDLLSAICGFKTTKPFAHLPLSENQLITFATLLANRRVDYSSIRNLLSDYLDCQVEINPCQGVWQTLPHGYQCKLGSANAKLGEGCSIGSKYWRNQGAIGLTLILNSIEQCKALLPGGNQHEGLCAMLVFLSDCCYQLNLTLVLAWQEIPPSALSTKMQLGQTSWLKSSPQEGQREQISYPKFSVKPTLTDAYEERVQ